MDLYEQLVEMDLTIFEHLAVVPQFPVLFGEDGVPRMEGQKIAGSSCPDFLALHIQEKHAYIVEVGKSLQSFKPRDLAARMIENCDQIERYVKWFAPGFDVLWRFYIRRKHSEDLANELSALGVAPDVRTLEDVFDHIKSVMP
jgi:hypothetical protein